MKKIMLKLGEKAANAAIAITAMNVNSACIWKNHQPILPENAKKLRKF